VESKTDQNSVATALLVKTGKSIMAEQFENPDVSRLEDVTVPDQTAEKRIDRMAGKAAEKASTAMHNYDQDRSIFWK